MSSLIDEYLERERKSIIHPMTPDDRRELLSWINLICRKRGVNSAYPEGLIPQTGLAVSRGNMTLAVGLLCLERTSRLAVFGFCVSNPHIRGRITADAVKEIIEAMPNYARSHGACALMSCFGRISINRLLDRAGYMSMELNETKIIRL